MSVSMPKSPRATSNPSLCFVIASILSIPCCSSIFAKISGLLSALLRRSDNSLMSLSVLAKDSAIKSTPNLMPSFISLLSLVVMVGRLILAPGKLTCFLPLITPASIALH